MNKLCIVALTLSLTAGLAHAAGLTSAAVKDTKATTATQTAPAPASTAKQSESAHDQQKADPTKDGSGKMKTDSFMKNWKIHGCDNC
ncbi:hypothetical protein CVU75_02110 [Candidatus Dependentiae bacterium HGW-Dependentiae-1]|nr:MAG: hypothetical protein CVU75_02110 [Candidatus Dependentiae bacterium HGW-Dependentiae-1]